MELPTLIIRASPFTCLGCWVVFPFFKFQKNIMYADSAVSDLGLHCLTMFHKKDVMLKDSQAYTSISLIRNIKISRDGIRC